MRLKKSVCMRVLCLLVKVLLLCWWADKVSLLPVIQVLERGWGGRGSVMVVSSQFHSVNESRIFGRNKTLGFYCVISHAAVCTAAGICM